MTRIRHVVQRLLSTLRRDRYEDDLDRELASHRALLAEDLQRRGMSPHQAQQEARRALGGIERVKDAHRDARSFIWLEQGRQDAAYAGRVLRRQPGFAASAVCTLALGIGASTAIFSVAYGVAVRPLPYKDPDRLLRLYEANAGTSQMEHDVSVGSFHDWRRGAPSIESAALFGKVGARFLTGPEGHPLTVRSVSPNFFDVLGVRPMLGQGFRPEAEYTRFTADEEAVISFEAWQRLLAGRNDVIGRDLEFVGVSDPDRYRIVGVMPPGFTFGEPVDVWKPSQIVEEPVNTLLRRWRYDAVVARMKPGASIDQVRAELQAVSARLATDFPRTNAGWTVTVKTLKDSVIGQFGRATWLLMSGVVVVLLVACLNVAALLIARAVSREREIALRAALGAGIGRLSRLWIVEAMILSCSGGAIGLALAWLGVRALRVAAPPGIPRIEEIGLDLPVLLAAIGATAIAIVASALAPVVVPLRQDPVQGLRFGSSGTGESPSRQALRYLLILGQCGGAAALLVLATMLTRSFIKLTEVDLGWNPQGMLSLRAEPPTTERRPWAVYVAWSDQLIAALKATPGIEDAAITTQVPLSPQVAAASIARGRGRDEEGGSRLTGIRHSVTDGYFHAIGMKLLQGRAFDDSDRFTASQHVGNSPRPDEGVAVVTASAARTLWPGESAIDKHLWLPDIDTVKWRRVVGVVEDVHFRTVGDAATAHVFVPWTQMPTGSPRLLVRAQLPSADLVPLVRGILQSVAPGTRVDQVVPVEFLAERATAQPRFTSRVVALFGLCAVALAGIGVHGTLAHIVRARRREIGIRLALGETPAGVTRRTLRIGVVPALAGGIAGVAAAIAIARSFRALLFELSPADGPSIALGLGLLLVAAAVAALGPARYASRVDPVQALRAE